jgi:hypothetical protein
MALRQNKFRFYQNNGTESTSTPLAAINTSISLQDGDETTFLIRFLIQSDASTAGTNTVVQFERNINAGAFAAITTSSSIVRALTTSVFADAASTTAQLAGTGTFESSSQGCTHDGSAGGAQMDIVANGNAETVCAVRLVAADVVPGDVIGIRISTTPTAITVYDQNATVTITAPPIVLGLDTGAVAGTGTDLLASGVLALDTAAGALAGEDLTPIYVVQLDTAAITASGADVAAHAIAVADTGAAAAAGQDLLASASVVLDLGAAMSAGADITAGAAGAELLDAGAVAVSGADILPHLTQIQLDLGAVGTSGSDIHPRTALLLDAAAAALATNNINTGGEIAVLLDAGSIMATAGELTTREDFPWQAFGAGFAHGQRFGVGFGRKNRFEVRA